MIRTNGSDNELEQILSVGLTCLEQGLDSKEMIKANILDCVKRNYFTATDIKELGDIPTCILELLNARLGTEFDVQDGKLIGACTELCIMKEGA